ncbi:MAG: hypothetical protein H6739_05405 [Alphaproteobacteria bacterium]|nr:hypothetical protein [Alphaproteobacteria bacterium]
MKDLLRENDGSRPSRLAMARAYTGEAEPPAGDAYGAWAAEVDAAKARLEPFDFEVLRAAAARVDDAPAARPAPTKAPWWRSLWLVPVLAAAVVVMVMVLPGEDTRTTRAKGDVDLDFLVMRGGAVEPGEEGEVLRAGDRIQFTYRADGLDSLVLLSVDGEGTLSVFYPAQGDIPVSIIPGDRHVLQGSIVLDDAPGPELFVGVFSPSSVDEARALVEDAWAKGGADAVEALRDTDPAVDVVRVSKGR